MIISGFTLLGELLHNLLPLPVPSSVYGMILLFIALLVGIVKEEQIKELQEFVARISANASKSKQATSRKKQLDKITLDDIKASSR